MLPFSWIVHFYCQREEKEKHNQFPWSTLRQKKYHGIEKKDKIGLKYKYRKVFFIITSKNSVFQFVQLCTNKFKSEINTNVYVNI